MPHVARATVPSCPRAPRPASVPITFRWRFWASWMKYDASGFRRSPNIPPTPSKPSHGTGVSATARRLGVEIEEIRVVTDSGVANKLIDAAFYPIEAGQVANIRFEVQGLVGGEPFVILEHINCCDFDAMPDGWPRGDARADLLYRVEVEGRPNLTTEVAIDYPIAAVRTVNAIPAVVAAKAGILPAQTCRRSTAVMSSFEGTDKAGAHVLRRRARARLRPNMQLRWDRQTSLVQVAARSEKRDHVRRLPPHHLLILGLRRRPVTSLDRACDQP